RSGPARRDAPSERPSRAGKPSRHVPPRGSRGTGRPQGRGRQRPVGECSSSAILRQRKAAQPARIRQQEALEEESGRALRVSFPRPSSEEEGAYLRRMGWESELSPTKGNRARI